MPSALETLVKILKLERDQGYKDTAVIGGLGSFAEKWRAEAHAQARIEMHHLLVDDLLQLMEDYEEMPSSHERHQAISYMLDRITMRIKEPREDFEPRYDWEPQPAEERHSDKQRQPPKPPERKPDRAAPRREPRPSTEDNHTPLEVEFTEAPHRAELDLPPQPRLERPPRTPRAKLDLAEQADRMRGLTASIEKVRGVGKTTSEYLEKLTTPRRRRLETVEDLLSYFPYRYDDYTKMLPIAKLEPGQVVTVIGTVRSPYLRSGRDFAFQLDDGSARLMVIFFGGKWLRSKIHEGDPLVLSGKVTIYRDQLQMTNPEWEPIDEESLHASRIIPVYRLTEGLKAKRLRNLIQNALNYWVDRMPDYLPEAVQERADLADLGWAFQNVHFPEGTDHLYHAQRRITFDELLLMQLALLRNRRAWQSRPAAPLEVSVDWLRNFLAAVFPYELTVAQVRAVNAILDDVALDIPMRRLVQGDVGSGKTAVALVALAVAFANDKQSVLMAPTGILAEQHFKSVTEAMEKMPGTLKPNVMLLTGALSKSERDAVYEGLASGEIDIVVGTHALIQPDVAFFDLGLVITDEQHRFGRDQREILHGKDETNPHVLEMTATPIPGTLALALYADWDVSTIDEMPPGRTPVKTFVRAPYERERYYDFIQSHLENGRQAFIVHPLVEASESVDTLAAVERYDVLKDVFFEYTVGLLHGKMTPKEKDEIMHAFAGGEVDVLVTTSVAEVGVNVPNATVMMIEGANRFGLAQLHQFRGRVGRGEYAGYCVLIPDTEDQVDNERLQTMAETTDGFELAARDLELRGAGDLLGTRQSGGSSYISMPACITDDLTQLAHVEARSIYAEDPDLSKPEHALLKQYIDQMLARDEDEGGRGG